MTLNDITTLVSLLKIILGYLLSIVIPGLLIFKADSDAIITKGIVALLIKVFSNRTPSEIREANLYFIDRIGLKQNLSPTRSNGLLSMIKQMRMYALAYEVKMNQKTE